MTETTLYRRNEDGSFVPVKQAGTTQGQTVAPLAPGKAAAISRYLAQGGTPFQKSRRYKKGKLKGLTVDQATAQAEAMWATAPDSIKQKYADRTSGPTTDLAPSERPGSITGTTPARITNASLNASLPGETTDQVYARQRESRMGKAGQTVPTATPAYDQDGNGIPDMVQRPSAPVVAPTAVNSPPSVASNNFAPGSDEARAAALTENSRNEMFATADTGTGSMQAAAAMQNTPRPMMLGGSVGSMYGQSLPETQSTASPSVKDELAKKQETERAQREVQFKAQKQREETAVAESERKRLGLPSGLPTDERMHAQGKVNGGPSPVVKSPPAQSQMPTAPVVALREAPTGAPLMSRPPSVNGREMDPAIKGDTGGMVRVNRTTGLPFGYNPSDTLPKSADATMQQRAGDSRNRQAVAPLMPGIRATPQAQAGAQRMMEADRVSPDRPRVTSIGPTPERPSIGLPGAQSAPNRTITGISPTPMPRGPASQPERVGSSLNDPNNAFSYAAYARTAAAQAQGVKRQATLSKAVNVDDPKKFYTGRTLPLDQLVRPTAPRKPMTVATRPVFAMGRR